MSLSVVAPPVSRFFQGYMALFKQKSLDLLFVCGPEQAQNNLIPQRLYSQTNKMNPFLRMASLTRVDARASVAVFACTTAAADPATFARSKRGIQMRFLSFLIHLFSVVSPLSILPLRIKLSPLLVASDSYATQWIKIVISTCGAHSDDRIAYSKMAEFESQ